MKDLRGFLGLTGYYGRFVKGYGIMAQPLTELTKINAVQWSNSEENAFQLLKQDLIIVPVLQLPDFTQLFVVECNASSEGIGAIFFRMTILLLILVRDFFISVV